MVPKNCAILTGTTASGKSEIAFSFAKERGDVELISADSLAVYRGTDIASGQTLGAGAGRDPASPHRCV